VGWRSGPCDLVRPHGRPDFTRFRGVFIHLRPGVSENYPFLGGLRSRLATATPGPENSPIPGGSTTRPPIGGVFSDAAALRREAGSDLPSAGPATCPSYGRHGQSLSGQGAGARGGGPGGRRVLPLAEGFF